MSSTSDDIFKADIFNDDEFGDALLRGRRAWPDVHLGGETFRQALLRLHADARVELEALHVTDLYLATACAHGDPVALAEFDRQYTALLGPTIGRFDTSADFGEEVRQRLRIRLMVQEGGKPARIASYTGRGSLRSWVHIAAARVAIALARGNRKSQSQADPTGTHEPQTAPNRSPEAQCVRSVHGPEVQQALADAVGTLSTRQRNALRLRYLEGTNIDGIGAIYRVHRTTAARWVADAKQHVRREARRILAARMRLTTTSVDSLLGSIESQLELSASLFR